MLQIGFGSVLLRAPGGIEPKFERTRALGGQFIEFYYQEMDEAGLGEPEYREIRRLSAAYGLPVTYHLPWHDPTDDLGQYEEGKGRKHLLHMMERGHAIGARYMVLHMGAYPKDKPRLVTLERVLRIVEGVIPTLVEWEAILCLENNTTLYTPNAIACSAFEMDTAFHRIHSPYVGMCLDTGHAHVNGCLMEMTDILASHIQYVHLHDNDGVADQHRAPGLGNIDWETWYRKLVLLPGSPWIMFEYPFNEGFERTIQDIRSA